VSAEDFFFVKTAQFFPEQFDGPFIEDDVVNGEAEDVTRLSFRNEGHPQEGGFVKGEWNSNKFAGGFFERSVVFAMNAFNGEMQGGLDALNEFGVLERVTATEDFVSRDHLIEGRFQCGVIDLATNVETARDIEGWGFAVHPVEKPDSFLTQRG